MINKIQSEPSLSGIISLTILRHIRSFSSYKTHYGSYPENDPYGILNK